MELSPSGLYGDDGAEGRSVAEDFLHGVVRHRLGLKDQISFRILSLFWTPRNGYDDMIV